MSASTTLLEAVPLHDKPRFKVDTSITRPLFFLSSAVFSSRICRALVVAAR